MKITAFLGSPRAGGNTDTIAASLLDGAHDAGAEAESVALRRLNIHPCIGCEKCWDNGRPCVFDDDMTQLYDTIAVSDVLVFATPVYWYGPTAIMKAFLDRFVVFNHDQGKPLIKGRRAILVVAYEEEGPGAAEPLMRMFEMSFDYLGVPIVERIVVDGVGPVGAVQNKPEALSRAREIGRSLCG